MKIGPVEIGCKLVDWIHLIQCKDKWRAPVYTNFRVTYKAGNLLSSCSRKSLLRGASLHNVHYVRRVSHQNPGRGVRFDHVALHYSADMEKSSSFEQRCLLGCDDVRSSMYLEKFRINLLPLSPG
jgi:hypothetical protein